MVRRPDRSSKPTPVLMDALWTLSTHILPIKVKPQRWRMMMALPLVEGKLRVCLAICQNLGSSSLINWYIQVSQTILTGIVIIEITLLFQSAFFFHNARVKWPSNLNDASFVISLANDAFYDEFYFKIFKTFPLREILGGYTIKTYLLAMWNWFF